MVRDLNFTYRSKALSMRVIASRKASNGWWPTITTIPCWHGCAAHRAKSRGGDLQSHAGLSRELLCAASAAGRWREILNTDAEIYGGTGKGNGGRVQAVDAGGSIGATLTLPPLAVIMLELEN